VLRGSRRQQALLHGDGNRHCIILISGHTLEHAAGRVGLLSYAQCCALMTVPQEEDGRWVILRAAHCNAMHRHGHRPMAL
jgi:hypothetical protein